jgi:hypothetical protein
MQKTPRGVQKLSYKEQDKEGFSVYEIIITYVIPTSSKEQNSAIRNGNTLGVLNTETFSWLSTVTATVKPGGDDTNIILKCSTYTLLV